MVRVFLCFAHISYCALCISLFWSCTMQIASDTTRIPWCSILSYVLVPLPPGSWIFFLDSCCSSVLLNFLIVSRWDYMSLLFIFMAAHLLLCGLPIPGIFCFHLFPEPFWTFLLNIWDMLDCLFWDQNYFKLLDSVCILISCIVPKL